MFFASMLGVPYSSKKSDQPGNIKPAVAVFIRNSEHCWITLQKLEDKYLEVEKICLYYLEGRMQQVAKIQLRHTSGLIDLSIEEVTPSHPADGHNTLSTFMMHLTKRIL